MQLKACEACHKDYEKEQPFHNCAQCTRACCARCLWHDGEEGTVYSCCHCNIKVGSHGQTCKPCALLVIDWLGRKGKIKAYAKQDDFDPLLAAYLTTLPSSWPSKIRANFLRKNTEFLRKRYRSKRATIRRAPHVRKHPIVPAVEYPPALEEAYKAAPKTPPFPEHPYQVAKVNREVMLGRDKSPPRPKNPAAPL